MIYLTTRNTVQVRDSMQLFEAIISAYEIKIRSVTEDKELKTLAFIIEANSFLELRTVRVAAEECFKSDLLQLISKA